MRNILFVLVFLLPSVAFGQRFNSIVNDSLYPQLGSDVFIPENHNQAILVWRIEPRGNYSNVVSASIVPSFSSSDAPNRLFNSPYGYSTNEGTVNVDGFSSFWTIIDSSNLYLRSGTAAPSTLNAIQNILASKNLGTVSQRQALINSFTGSPVQIINPSDIYAGFLNLFGPYANIFIGVFLTLFVVDLMTRKTKATVAESAKVARAAERREINQQIKNDTTAQVYKYRLSNLAGIKSGRIQDSEISQSQARRMFRETAEEYAEYRRSRGWVY